MYSTDLQNFNKLGGIFKGFNTHVTTEYNIESAIEDGSYTVIYTFVKYHINFTLYILLKESSLNDKLNSIMIKSNNLKDYNKSNLYDMSDNIRLRAEVNINKKLSDTQLIEIKLDGYKLQDLLTSIRIATRLLLFNVYFATPGRYKVLLNLGIPLSSNDINNCTLSLKEYKIYFPEPPTLLMCLSDSDVISLNEEHFKTIGFKQCLLVLRLSLQGLLKLYLFGDKRYSKLVYRLVNIRKISLHQTRVYFIQYRSNLLMSQVYYNNNISVPLTEAYALKNDTIHRVDIGELDIQAINAKLGILK